uniref:Reverse transcriptase domain-containing protein n=1 Tax=Tanacetum cinerariifolium TaxID=118510 RepID=A0A699L323_TANCI|nr:hypothetical protein [Tanacetum cinerariifolium]
MATIGGTFFSWPIEEEWQFFEKLSKGSKTQASVDRNNSHTSFANFVSNQHGTNFKISELSKKLDLLLRNLRKGVSNVSQDGAIIPTSIGRMMTITIALTIPNNKNMVTNQGGLKHVNMVTSLGNGKTYNNDIKIPSAHEFSHDVEDFVTDDEIIAECKKADNVMSNSELANDLLKDFPKPPTQNPKATESPKVGEGGVSSTTTSYPAALDKSASARLAKMVLILRICGRLSSNINILPASVVDKYDLGTLRKTDTIISLAGRSTKIPRGILEDVIMKVDDFYYPVDFFVMDIESPYKDVQLTIILGRPFLATIDARINC